MENLAKQSIRDSRELCRRNLKTTLEIGTLALLLNGLLVLIQAFIPVLSTVSSILSASYISILLYTFSCGETSLTSIAIDSVKSFEKSLMVLVLCIVSSILLFIIYSLVFVTGVVVLILITAMANPSIYSIILYLVIIALISAIICVIPSYFITPTVYLGLISSSTNTSDLLVIMRSTFLMAKSNLKELIKQDIYLIPYYLITLITLGLASMYTIPLIKSAKINLYRSLIKPSII